MWGWIIGIVIGIAIFLLMSPTVQHAKAARFGDFQFPRADFGAAVPVLWGRFRQNSPIMIWYGGFRSVPIKKRIKTGLFSSTTQTIGHKYYFTMDLLLCAGPNVVLKKIWVNGNKLLWEGSQAVNGTIFVDKPDILGGSEDGGAGGIVGNFNFYRGNSSSQDPALVSFLGPNVPTYSGMCRVVLDDVYIGNTTSPPQFSFELERIPATIQGSGVSGAMPNGKDMNPIAVVLDAATSKSCGGENLSKFDLPTFVAAAEQVYDEAFSGMDQGFSQILQSTSKAEDIISDALEHVDALMFENRTNNKLAVKLLRKDYDEETIPHFMNSDIVKVSDISRSTWATTFNRCRVSFNDRDGAYDDAVAIADDFALIQYQGKVRATERPMPSVCTKEGARWQAAHLLGYVNIPLLSMTVELNRSASYLNVGDVIKLTFSRGRLNFTGIVCRIMRVNIGSIDDGVVEVKVVQDRYSAHIGSYSAPEGTGFQPPSSEALPVVKYTLQTAPHFLASEGEDLSVWDTSARELILAAAPGSLSQAFNAFEDSTTDIDRSDLATISNGVYSASGVLSADYIADIAYATRVDISESLVVTGLSAGELAQIGTATSLDDVRSGEQLMLIGSELFVYLGATISGSTVTFQTIHRAVLDTEPATHVAGSTVWFIDGSNSVGAGVIPNTTRYVKFQDITPTDRYKLSDAVATSYVANNRAARPLPPADVRLNGSRTPSAVEGSASVTVSWKRRSRNDTSIRTYTEADVSPEANVLTRVKWRIGGGAYTEVTSAGTSLNIDVALQYGLLEVIVEGYNTSKNLASLVSETLYIELLEPEA